MKLNIYDKKKIVKTYTADTYDLMFGTLEDVADAINLDAIKDGSDAEIIKMAAQLALGCKDTVRDLMKDVFDGITDDELRHTTVSEIAVVLLDIVRYTLSEMGKLKTKN